MLSYKYTELISYSYIASYIITHYQLTVYLANNLR